MSFLTARLRDFSSNAQEREKLLLALLTGLFAAYGWLLAKAALEDVWIISLAGSPVAADFTAFWEAARLAIEGQAASAYDWRLFEPRLMAAIPVRPEDAKFPFFYPPSFFLFVAPLGALPYLAAAALWIMATLAAYLAASRAIWPDRKAVWIALAAPAGLWCICIGQNGLLTAALIGGALLLLDRRPIIAGLLIGLLAYKPHFGVLLPLVLMATGRWRVFGIATATVILTNLASIALFGWEIVPAFINAMTSGGDRLLALGELPWAKMQSFYGLVRFAGFGEVTAWSVHGLIAAATAAALVLLWRSRVNYDLKAAALALGALVVSPYSCIYDLPVLTIAALFLLRQMQISKWAWEAPILLCALMLPLLFPVLNLPLGPILYALMGVTIFLRLQAESGEDFLVRKWWVRWDSNPGQLD
jgi:alpha-1,2-mannosyltransferase